MNSTIKSGGLKELEFGGYLTLYFWKRCRDELILFRNCLTLVENFVYNEANFKLYPVPDWKPMEFLN